MSESGKQHNKEFKINAVKYVIEHPELTQRQCCKNLGIGLSTLGFWRHEYKQNHGDVPVRGSGNYSSDEQKEIAHLKRQLRDATDAPDVLKKAISILGKN
ncbi:transposase [Pectinatus frisingensis]|uniref:transposase n=1 Tax=Pectinatus frisingensis TaxID=865 RepID=UPI0018C5600F|nr:transposase [Pectinatus frisingensis]